MSIPKQILNQILNDKYYSKCARHKENTCKGRVTFEHVFIYGGKQIQEVWAIIPLCEFHHNVLSYQDTGDLRKDLNEYIALQRATPEQLALYPKRDWSQRKRYLSDKYKDYQL